MDRPLIDLVAGARPNFMKVAPLYKELASRDQYDLRFVHTGQHYSPEMSELIMADLGLPAPDVHLGVGSAGHAEQTAGVMMAYEKLCTQARPDWAVVVGDVNSTLAAALVAAKIGIPVAHLEAGLRSRDMSMPEEINRLLTDQVSTLCWAPSDDAVENLRAEGIAPDRIEMVGNVMIDTFELLRDRIASVPRALTPATYGLVTLHRPSNVDDPKALNAIVDALIEVSGSVHLVFPVHPRTHDRLHAAGLWRELETGSSITLSKPLGYIDFMAYVLEAQVVITDSGGVQEETTYLGIPCLTLRDTTERPITITAGTNQLVSAETLPTTVRALLEKPLLERVPPPLWDGHTAQRVADSLHRHIAV